MQRMGNYAMSNFALFAKIFVFEVRKYMAMPAAILDVRNETCKSDSV